MRPRRGAALALAVVSLLSLLLVQPAASEGARRDLRDGDLIFHVSRSAQSRAIMEATGSRYSHMGLVFHREGRPEVLEAVATVRYTPLERFIARGEAGHYVVKRLRDADRSLTPESLARLRREAESFRGKPYDLAFEWSDARIYCSELAFKAYARALGEEVGVLRPLGSYALTSPAVRRKLRERYGEEPPLDEPMIAPASLFDSPRLVTVATVGAPPR